jgi:aspartokinase
MKLVDNIYVTEDVTLFSLCDAPADIAHMAEVFKLIADAGIDVDMISQFPLSGANSGFSFTVSDNDFVPVLSIASEVRNRSPKTKISVSSGNCKITVSGEEMRGTPGVSATGFKAVSSVDADVRMITTSEIEIAMLVVKSDVDAVIEAIKKEFAE